ncbi:MAG: AsmA family protein [Kordiimonadaceae bacterium]|nr:AsmA family protein [Kordiimonadaceae bacterium]
MALKLRKVGFWFVGLLIALVASLSIALSFLDWNQYRDTLSNVASSQMGMKVELAGNVSLALFPRPSLSAATVRISPAGEGFSDVVATADQISMRLGYSDFFKGKVAVHSIAFEGLTVAIEEDAEGTWHVRGWTSSSEDGNATSLSRVEITNSDFELRPFGAPVRNLEVTSLKMSGALPLGPLDWDGLLSLDGQEIQIAGRLKPVSVRDEISIKAVAHMADTILEISGRIAENGNVTGRATLVGPRLGTASLALTRLIGLNAPGLRMPEIPFALDLQLSRTGDIARVISRQLEIGDTRGRLDLTIASRKDKVHVAGSVSFGVIDWEKWQAALPEEEVASGGSKLPVVPSGSSMLKIRGSLDVTVEGVKMQGGLGQRIDAVIAFRETGIAVTSLQALLPGAANLSVLGEMGQREGSGNIRLQVGNVSALAAWLGVQVPSDVASGRLATASGRGDIQYSDGSWTLTNFKASVDTSSIEGELSGQFPSLIPQQVRLNFDTLNLDAYGFTQKSAGDKNEPLVVPENVTLAFDITAETLHSFGKALGTARFVGALNSGRLDIEFLSLIAGDSSLTAKGSLTNSEQDLAVELNADFKNWEMPIVQFYVEGLQSYLIAGDMQRVDGKASAVGVLSRMRLGFGASSDERSISLSGELGFPAGRLTFVEMQGALRHQNMAPIARLSGFNGLRSLPVELTFSLLKTGEDEALVSKIRGDFAGGKLQATLTNLAGLRSANVTFDHARVSDLVALTGLPLDLAEQAESLRTEFSWASLDDGWQLTVPSLKNGTQTVTGQMSLTQDNVFSGVMELSGLTVASGLASPDATSFFDIKDWAEPLRVYAGSLRLKIEDVVVSGQTLVAPAGEFSVGDQTALFSLGEGAQVNGAPASFNVNFALAGDMPFTGKAVIEALDFEKALTAEGLGGIVASSVSGEISFAGDMASERGLAKSLKGTGSLKGGPGQLKFLSAVALVRAAQAADTRRDFLTNVGSLLRGGETPIEGLTLKYTMDGGVMLVEQAEATGSWGKLALDGQVNFADDFLSMKGALALTLPPDTPAIPVRYQGSLRNPASKWTGQLFERFVIAGIERRLRSTLYRDLETRNAASGTEGETPGLAVFARAFEMLQDLRKAQMEKKRLAEVERRRRATEAEAARLETQGS